MHRETAISPADLIWPLFVTEGSGVEEPIASLPGVSRWSADLLAERARDAVKLGIPCIGFGPGNEIYAHAVNEHVPLADVVEATKFYALLPTMIR